MKKILLLIACMAAMTAKATDRLPLKGGWNYVFYGKTEVQLTKQYA